IWKIKGSERLPAWIQILHHDVQHLPGESRIALGNLGFRTAPSFSIAFAIGMIAIRPCGWWQPGASSANQSRLLREGEPHLKRPIGNLLGGCARRNQRSQP